MKPLKEILRVEGYEAPTKDGKKFVAKHTVKKTPDANKNGDDVFNASKIKPVQRQPRHGYNPGKDKEVYEENELTEKLSVSQGIAAWIKDFVHSKNPRFDGKSRKERIEMAKGAFYAAKRGE